MKSFVNKKTGKAMSCALALAGLTVTAQAQLNVTSVGVLNQSPVAGGSFIGFVNAPNNVANLSFVTEASMASIVSSAFSGNAGGVVNFEIGTGWSTLAAPTNAFSVAYGASLSQTLTVGVPGQLNSFDSTLGGSVPTTAVPSGQSYAGFSSQNLTYNFSQGLVDWGMFVINRNAARTETLTFTLADTTTISFAADTLASGGPDLWFGVQASAANPIVGVSINQSGFASWDDMAFVVAPVPEPTTMALVGMGSLAGLLAIRRRRC